MAQAVIRALGALGLASALAGQARSARAQASVDRSDADQPATVTTASAALGAGVFDRDPAGAVDLGLDVAGRSFTLGVGARLRFVAGEGLRRREWDETSERVAILRYATYQRLSPDARVRVAAAAGELSGVTVGRGALVDGYGSGLHVDHRHLGAQLRLQVDRVGAEVFVDDLVAPRIFAGRGELPVDEYWRVGGELAMDRVAPTMDGTAALTLASVDATYTRHTRDGRHWAQLYGAGVAVLGEAAGLHVGALGSARAGERGRVWFRNELRLGTRHYVPGWIGPLYERDREVFRDSVGVESAGLLEAARMSDLSGIGGLTEIGVEVERLGTAQAGYAWRRGISDLLTARLALPSWHSVQAGLWSAAELRARETEAYAVGGELRARLPRQLFARFELARQFRDGAEGELVPVWSALAALGGVFGE